MMVDEQIAELLARHNGNAQNALAWCLGYIDNIERARNTCLEAMGRRGDFTLSDDLIRSVLEKRRCNQNISAK